MADIAPAMSFYFGFGFLAATSGIASPLTIISAGIAVAFLANTLSRYMQAHPSTGSFITFIGMALGPVLALTTAIVLIGGYLVNIFSIMAISGGFMTMFLQNYFHSFPILDVADLHPRVRRRGCLPRDPGESTFGALGRRFLPLRVHHPDACQHHRAHPARRPSDAAPFNPHYLLSGFKGLGLGFPLAVYMFIGWEAAGPMAEETDQPRKNIPRALFLPAWRSCWAASCCSPMPRSRPSART